MRQLAGVFMHGFATLLQLGVIFPKHKFIKGYIYSTSAKINPDIFRLFLISDRRHKVVIPRSKDITIMHYDLYQAS
jgi:hypothetical protein